MRIRTIDNTTSEAAVNTVSWGPRSNYVSPPVTDIDPTYFVRGWKSHMEDVVGDFEGENPCYHYTQTYSSGASGHPWSIDHVVAPAGNCATGIINGPGGGISISNLWSQFGVPVNHPSTASLLERNRIPDYSAEGWSNVYPVIREELKLLNSIYELKDFAHLPQLFRNTRSSLRGLGELSSQLKWTRAATRRGELRLMYDILSPQSPATWSYMLKLPKYKLKKLALGDMVSRMVSLGKIVPEHFLNWKFAVEPLLRDMAHFFNASRSVANQLPGLLARADGETVHKSHWSKVLDPHEIEGLDFLNSDEAYWTGPTVHVYTKPWCEMSEGPKYTFSARYTYKYSPEALRFAAALARRDALGVNLSASNIWQAIPWSFAIDWFSKVGKALEPLTPHNLEPIVQFYGASQSLKYKVQYGCTTKFAWVVNSDYSVSGTGEWELATKIDECYIRQGVIPFLSLPKTSDFSTMEKLLALALGLSSVRYTS